MAFASGLRFALSPREILALARKADAEACRRSLAEFVKLAWPIIEPGVPLTWGWHIDAVCAHLEAVTRGDITKLVINIPPGTMKSTLVCVMWKAWEWIDQPHLRYLTGSYDEKLAMRDAMKTRDIVTSGWFRDLFRPAWRLKKDQNAKSYFINDRQGFRLAFAVGGKVTGWRGNGVILDDPLNARDQFNAAVKAATIWKYDKVLSTRVNDPRLARFIVVMQRLADDDLSGELLRRTLDMVDENGDPLTGPDGRPLVDDDGKPLKASLYDHLCLPSEFEPKRRNTTSIGWTDPRTELGELLFPQFFTRKVIDELKQALGMDGFAGQHQQRPVAAEGSRFKGKWFRYWEWADDREPGSIRLHRGAGHSDLVLLQHCEVFATVDVAVGEKRRNDFTVYQVWAKTRAGDLLLLHQVKGQWSEPDSIAQALAVQKLFPIIGCFVVEATGVGRPLGQQLMARHLAVRLVEATVDKLIMSIPAVVKAEAGRIFLPSGPAWVPEFLGEVTLFPNAAHDDQVSALSLAAIAVQTEGGLTGKATSAKPDPRDGRRDRDDAARHPTRDLFGRGR